MEQNTRPKTVTKNKMQLKTIAKVGVLGAVAAILMLFEIPLFFCTKLLRDRLKRSCRYDWRFCPGGDTRNLH